MYFYGFNSIARLKFLDQYYIRYSQIYALFALHTLARFAYLIFIRF